MHEEPRAYVLAKLGAYENKSLGEGCSLHAQQNWLSPSGSALPAKLSSTEGERSRNLQQKRCWPEIAPGANLQILICHFSPCLADGAAKFQLQ